MASPLAQAIKQIAEEKNIAFEIVVETIEAALAAAFRKDFGKKNQNIKVEFDTETGKSRVFDVKTVVTDEFVAEALKAMEAENFTPPAPPAPGEPEEPKYNPKLHLSLTEARAIKPDAKLDEEIRIELEVPAEYGRMAATTAKQVITQRLREAERNVIFAQFKDKEHTLIPGIIQRREGRSVLVDLGRGTGTMLPDDQISTEEYRPGERVKVYVVSVAMGGKGPEILVSRTHPEIIRKLFTMEIPEVAAGTVLVKSIAREAGSRSKVAVSSTAENVDPIGSAIGQRGSRIQTIIAELGGEKIDIIMFDEDPVKFITNALSPAKIAAVELHEAERVAVVRVPADQLSLAIGRGGQNVRLAARLTGWKVNIIEEGKEEEIKEDVVPA